MRKRGREKQFFENVRLSLREGTTDRIDALLVGKEARLDFIRDAIEREIERRTQKEPPDAPDAPGSN